MYPLLATPSGFKIAETGEPATQDVVEAYLLGGGDWPANDEGIDRE